MVFANHRRASFEYDFSPGAWEMGLVLKGKDVRNIRLHKVNITEAYGVIHKRELWLKNINIAGIAKDIKLLARRKEINNIAGTFNKKSYVLIPIKLYDSSGLIKIYMGLGKKTSNYDKREKIKARDLKREERYI